MIKKLLKPLRRKLLRVLPTNLATDRFLSRLQYLATYGRLPNYRSPKTLTELISRQRFGLRNEALATRTTDKELAKGYLREKLEAAGLDASAHLLATRFVTGSLDDPRLREVHGPAVVKTTHDSGGVVVLTEERGLNEAELAKLRASLAEDYYFQWRERHYRGLKPKVMVEELFMTSEGAAPEDYKVFCYGGRPLFIQVDVDRATRHRRALFDCDWRVIEGEFKKPRPDREVPRPAQLETMLRLARLIAADFELVRIDFYQNAERVVFGEITHVPEAGAGVFRPAALDRELFLAATAATDARIGSRMQTALP
jgi:hypothetical protein